VPTGDLTPAFIGAALVALAGFTAKFVLDVVADSRKQRDAALTALAGLTASVDKLADVVKDGFRELRP
jgi:predicted component of type VI protein secretion system